MRFKFSFLTTLVALVALACIAADVKVTDTRPGIRIRKKAKPRSIPGSPTPVDVQFAWDASEGNPTNLVVTNYVLYVHTNNLFVVDRSESVYKINAGTNLTALAKNLLPALTWYAAVSAQATYEPWSNNATVLESELSNIILIAVPNPPTNNRVVIEYSMNLTNFTDMGYFRLRIEEPDLCSGYCDRLG